MFVNHEVVYEMPSTMPEHEPSTRRIHTRVAAG